MNNNQMPQTPPANQPYNNGGINAPKKVLPPHAKSIRKLEFLILII